MTELLSDPALDPCSGVAGIVCENGHIVALLWENLDMNMLHTDVGLLSELRQLSVGLNSIESLPSSICSCTNLLIFLFHSNLLTSLPDCISTLTKLTSFSVGHNNIKILPDLSEMNKLITIFLANNQLESLSPTMFEKMQNLQEFNVGDNKIHSPVPNVSQCKKLRLFYIYGNLFYGHTDQNMFNQMQDLEYVDIQSNMIEGELPAFIDTPNIVELLIQNNLFKGSIPSSWQYFTSLEVFLGDHNLIESPIIILGSLNTLTELSLSHNRLTSSIGDQVNDGNVGTFVATTIGSLLTKIDLSYNQIDGIWPDNNNYQNNIETINVAHNEIEEFPQIFLRYATSIQSFDISFNNLQGSFPDLEEGSEPIRTLSNVDARGNPNFHGPDFQLPEWSIIRTDQYSKTLDQPFLCPGLGSRNAPEMVLKVDPSYYAYSTCVCDRGTFGGPPECFIIPESQDINGVEYPVFSYLNDTFTDSWYGEQRMTSGLSTSWVIDKRVKIETLSTASDSISISSTAHTSVPSSNAATQPSTIFEVQSSSSSTSYFSLFSSLSSTSGSTSSSPVLMINVTFYVNLDLFDSFTDILEIYEGNKQICTNIYSYCILLTVCAACRCTAIVHILLFMFLFLYRWR
jgi:Leucine-rich repeat (LRR) protein